MYVKEVKAIMSPEQTHVFELLDEYSKKQYKCFVAEMSLNEHRGKYAICFRPTAEHRGDPDPYLCRYVYLDLNEVAISHKAGRLSNTIIKELDEQLSSIKDSL
jgi:hypothetical protein